MTVFQNDSLAGEGWLGLEKLHQIVFNSFLNYSFAGEGWLGLEKLHQITSKTLYRLKVTLTARNWTRYVGYYDWMKVRNANLMIRLGGLEIGYSISNI